MTRCFTGKVLTAIIDKLLVITDCSWLVVRRLPSVRGTSSDTDRGLQSTDSRTSPTSVGAILVDSCHCTYKHICTNTHTHTHTHTWTLIKPQETQLSLQNRATRLESVKVTKHGTIPYVRYGFLLVCDSNFVRKTHVFEIFDFKNAVTLKTGLRVREGH